MTTLKAKPGHNFSQSTDGDQEAKLIASLGKTMKENGLLVRREDVANFYVAIKSKPLAILAGPARSGKIALAQCLAHSLVKLDSLDVQMISGHPWWAERYSDVATYTGMHSRYCTEKMLAIIEEASRPENARRVFFACLTRISPAELLSYFTEVAFQLQHGGLMTLGDSSFSKPIPFPSNLFIIGTMDTPVFDWWDNNLLEESTVIQWSPGNMSLSSNSTLIDPLEEGEFLFSCIRRRGPAYRKVYPFLHGQRQPFQPLLEIESILSRYISSPLEQITDEVMVFMANSWSKLGNGLFHPSPERNFTIALDLAITQILLSRAVEAIRALETLRRRLDLVFADRFPHSSAFVTSLTTA